MGSALAPGTPSSAGVEGLAAWREERCAEPLDSLEGDPTSLTDPVASAEPVVSADDTPGTAKIDAPIPRAAANAPTLPTINRVAANDSPTPSLDGGPTAVPAFPTPKQSPNSTPALDRPRQVRLAPYRRRDSQFWDGLHSWGTLVLNDRLGSADVTEIGHARLVDHRARMPAG